MSDQKVLVTPGETAEEVELFKPLTRIGGGDCGESDPVELYASEIFVAI